MCGIAGFAGKGEREALERMITAIKHRGPDDGGVLLREGVGLAHARLAIIDTSPGGHQPMENAESDVAITYNGEIYNYQELRNGLLAKGCLLRTHSDTEVLLWLYKTEGEDFLKRCVGMFALALYDFKEKKLILARDRMGEKPLYWAKKGETLYFASELSALLASHAIDRSIDTLSLSQYLAFDYVPTPRTILRGVSKLEPGSLLIFKDGGISKKTFWQLPKKEISPSLNEAKRELENRLVVSAKRQLVSDVPLGVFLSGGIDSSTVAYFAQQASKERIETFSIGFDEPSFDESVYARRVAEHLGTNHHEERLSGKDALDLIPEIADVFSEPVADASVLPTMLLSRFTRKSVTVALGGDGGDELFAGYPTFHGERVFNSMPSVLRKSIRAASEYLPTSHRNFSFTYNLKKLVSEDEKRKGRRHASWLGTFSPSMQQSLSAHIEETDAIYEHIDRYEKELPGMNGVLWMYARTYLLDQVLVKVDRASMHYALEARAPFLDHELVEFVFSLPENMKYRRGITKYLLKETMRGKLPDSIISRKKKGFGVPLARWLTKELRTLCDELLSPENLKKHGFLINRMSIGSKTNTCTRKKTTAKNFGIS
jgi:asparagine synthase (glutamine-hydrolysing)